MTNEQILNGSLEADLLRVLKTIAPDAPAGAEIVAGCRVDTSGNGYIFGKVSLGNQEIAAAYGCTRWYDVIHGLREQVIGKKALNAQKEKLEKEIEVLRGALDALVPRLAAAEERESEEAKEATV